MFGEGRGTIRMALNVPQWVDRSKKVSEALWLWSQQRFLGSFFALVPGGRAKVDLDFSYFVSFDSEEFRVPEPPPFLVLLL